VAEIDRIDQSAAVRRARDDLEPVREADAALLRRLEQLRSQLQRSQDRVGEWQDDEAENGRRRKKPWRYRWPEPVRDEVLARLLALNAQRAEEERLALGGGRPP
jgi:hypothetical protein